jgi:hypothetical protein
MSADPNATPVVPIPNVQSRSDAPVDTAYAPNYTDILQQIDAERDNQGQASISSVTDSAATPLHGPNSASMLPFSEEPQNATQITGNQWQPPPQPAVTSNNQQFEYERQGPGGGPVYYPPPPTHQPEQIEYYTGDDSEIPFHVKHRGPILAAAVFLIATLYVQPKVAPMVPSLFPGGAPTTLGVALLAAVAAVGFYVADRSTLM